ncbi:flavin reductase family protein [Bacillus sp. DJP31]|uniref:flavin reductase family protein n=1 Tax=Bacillus sp. DJP31 TaxID=3409789 RepID=UPI003BB540C1
MLKSTNEIVMHSYPGMVAIVTSKFEEKTNIMAAGWHTYISYNPPIYGVAIAKERFTHNLVTCSNEFVINFLPGHLASIIQSSGTLSGNDVDKFRELDLGYDKGETVKCPILHDAYVAYECKVMDIQTYGDHDWVVGEITKFHRDEDKFLENGLPDFDKLEIPLYVGRSKYMILDKKTELKNYYHG